MYQDIKIQRYKLTETMKDFDPTNDFNLIDGFKDELKNCIFTDIKITDYKEPIKKAFQSRLQVLLSSTLLRALMLKEGAVNALNEANFPAYYSILKSYLEVAALLGYVVDIIHHSDDYNEIIPKINTLHMGNREAGSFPTGSVRAINVLTMFEKLDKVLKGIGSHGKTAEELKKIIEEENILTSTYADICNYGHINFNAHLSIGIINSDSWVAKRDASGYKGELYSFYMPGFVIATRVITMLCGIILRDKKVNNFNLLDNVRYFE